jgi:hypothetical protein
MAKNKIKKIVQLQGVRDIVFLDKNFRSNFDEFINKVITNTAHWLIDQTDTTYKSNSRSLQSKVSSYYIDDY